MGKAKQEDKADDTEACSTCSEQSVLEFEKQVAYDSDDDGALPDADHAEPSKSAADPDADKAGEPEVDLQAADWLASFRAIGDASTSHRRNPDMEDTKPTAHSID